jgi:ubiquinone/menaquinone biosynthesis C-methylase UbiE
VSSRSYFDAVASDWDTLRRGFFSTHVREAALDALAVEAGHCAADVGAGTGFMTEALLERGVAVVAIDDSPRMLEVLQAKLGQVRVECRLSSGQSLPLDTASVDYAVANMYLHHVEDPAEAIGEMVRILRPGGALAITDLDAHAFEFLREEHHDRWLGFSHGDIQRWLAQAGAAGVEIRTIGMTCDATSAAGNTHASINIFLALARRLRPGRERLAR